MATKIQVRRDTSANWTSLNPTLSSGEIGYETNTGKFKIGNGSNLWSALDYFLDSSDLSGYLTASSASTTYQTKVANVSDAEIGYLDGVTSSIQTQLNTKLSESSASNTYLTQTSASSTYLTQSSASIIYAPVVPATQTSFRNVLINGGFSIDQRNSGASQAINKAAPLVYTVDRWYAYCEGGAVNSSRVAGAAPSQYYYRFTGDNSNTLIGFGQRIEAANSFHLAGQPVTLSVNLASTSLTSITWTAYYANTTDTFGSLASPTRTQIATGTLAVTSTLGRKSATFTVPSAATTGIEVLFTSGALLGSQTLTFDDAQLELGSIATPFEQRPITTELALCQRYYYRRTADSVPYTWTYGFATSTSSGEFLFTHPVTMRISPTPEIQGTMSNYALDQGGGINPTALASLRNNTYVSELSATIGASTLVSFRPYRLYAPGVTGGYIGFIAEL